MSISYGFADPVFRDETALNDDVRTANSFRTDSTPARRANAQLFL
jgi:hypothetical protein